MKLTTLKNWEKKKKPALPEETSKPKQSCLLQIMFTVKLNKALTIPV